MSVEEALKDPHPEQEYIVLGLSKGCVLFFNTLCLTQVFNRFTVHREAIKIIRYLPNTKCYISTCSEGTLNIWRIGQDYRVHVLR